MISIGDGNEYIPSALKVRLDSQQPWLDVQIDKAHVVFPATREDMKLVIKPPWSTFRHNDPHITVVITFLRALNAYRSSEDRICPEHVTLICPYKEQVKRVIERFSEEGVKYNRCLTVDGSQRQESSVVIFMFTKPRTHAVTEVGALSSSRRLNVALTLAKKLLIVVVSLRIWNAKSFSVAKGCFSRYLVGFRTRSIKVTFWGGSARRPWKDSSTLSNNRIRVSAPAHLPHPKRRNRIQLPAAAEAPDESRMSSLRPR